MTKENDHKNGRRVNGKKGGSDYREAVESCIRQSELAYIASLDTALWKYPYFEASDDCFR